MARIREKHNWANNVDVGNDFSAYGLLGGFCFNTKILNIHLILHLHTQKTKTPLYLRLHIRFTDSVVSRPGMMIAMPMNRLCWTS